MAHYIGLLQWTQQGVEKVKESPARLDAARQAFASMGVTFKDIYLTMGQYDLICHMEAPDDETLAKAILAVASKGSVRTQTLRAFTEAEYRRIVASLP
jgi:uncharacterized protein with GYD domain